MISQPAPAVIEKSPFYEIIQKYNAKIDYRPFIKVVGVSLKEFRSQRVEILEHTAVVFTNRTTVDSFFRICEEARITVPETMKYFCNTEAIALYLQKYIVYRKRKIFFADGKFDTFMELILKHKEEKFLVSLTEPNNGEVPDTMEKLKLNLSKVVLAKTVAADLEGIEPSQYDLMVFYSPSEISTLVSAFGVESIPTVATFGTSTACSFSRGAFDGQGDRYLHRQDKQRPGAFAGGGERQRQGGRVPESAGGEAGTQGTPAQAGTGTCRQEGETGIIRPGTGDRETVR